MSFTHTSLAKLIGCHEKAGVRRHLTVFACLGLLFANPACSNALQINTQSISKSDNVETKSLNLQLTDQLAASASGEILGVTFLSRDKVLVLLKSGQSLEVNLADTKASPVTYELPSAVKTSGEKAVALGNDEYWSLSKSKVTLQAKKDGDSVQLVSANVDFAEEPVILAATRNSVLLRVGEAYKLLRVAGRVEVVYDDVLNFYGRSSQLSNILGVGIIGDSGFWVTDGSRLISILPRSAGEIPSIIVQKIKLSSGDFDYVSVNIDLSQGRTAALGSAVARRRSDGGLFKSQSLGEGAGKTDVTPTDKNLDPTIAELIKNNCAGCHGASASNAFQNALSEDAWKKNAAAIKSQLEANTMPPGGGKLEVRQSLAAFLKKLTGLEVNIPSSEPKPVVTVVPDKNVFDPAIKTIIQTSCVNSCHEHGFQLGKEASFDRVKLNASAMKGRVDNNSMPRSPVTISAQDRALLSKWLGDILQ